MSLYPAPDTVEEYYFQVDATHTLYVEVLGNPAGIPVLYLHGGPGGACTPENRRYFDPARYRIILFDQRGSGRSMPAGCLTDNTTAHLLADIRQIQQRLKIARWVLFGGSWGSTLALLYAQAYPEQVLGMVLRGSFLARPRDWLWFVQDGGPRLFPTVWAELLVLLPAETNGLSITERLHQAVFSDDQSLSGRVAAAWQHWGRVMVNRSANVAAYPESDWPECINHSRIELHYARHGYFIDANQILAQIGRLPKVPVRLIHGQLDWICPPESSYLLAQGIPEAELRVLDGVGHVAGETSMADALRKAADDMLHAVKVPDPDDVQIERQ